MILNRTRPRLGMMLIGFIILIPIALGFFLTTLSRLDTLGARARRDELCIQARLLAESALERWDDAKASGSDEVLTGVIEGAGTYRLVVEGTADAPRIAAIGACDSPVWHAEARIECELQENRLRPVAIATRIEPRAQPVP